jgi:enediyne biosynthesis protein E4
MCCSVSPKKSFCCNLNNRRVLHFLSIQPYRAAAIVMLSFLFFNCEQRQIPEKNNTFCIIPPEASGVTFTNYVNDTSSLNFFNMANIYVGGGVALADINNDGLLDIYFSSNQGKGSLYLNLGDFKFEDITSLSNILIPEGWTTGVVFADVNGDGFQDLYVCRGGNQPSEKTRNLLFINNGDLTFTEASRTYGIDDIGLTTSATFFDMDNDGDLDLYVMNYPVFDEDPSSISFMKLRPSDTLTTDRLYKNVDGKFKDVTLTAGLQFEKGSGLGIIASDINLDGWIDLYIANDWLENDKLYINNKDGTFTEVAKTSLSNSSYFSMGVDIADLDNDLLPEIFVTDMAPDNHYRRNLLVNQASTDFYFLQNKAGLLPQVSRNTLQHNRGNGSFAEIAQFAGISRTDWSWATLLFDYNNDGLKDVFVTNGNKRDVGNMDVERLLYTHVDSPRYRNSVNDLIAMMPIYKNHNYLYKNMGEMRFNEISLQEGLVEFVNSQATAYGDLNNDGHIDLVVNNTDTVSFIYKNSGVDNNSSISISIKGKSENTIGLGTKAILYIGNTHQYVELTNARGFQSSSTPIIHFGIGKSPMADSILVIFPSGSYSVLKEVPSGSRLMLEEAEAMFSHFDYKNWPKRQFHARFEEKTDNTITQAFKHTENFFIDFKREKLIYRKYSKEGPALAVADVNNDGLEDFYIGGASGQPGMLYLQNSKGTFSPVSLPSFIQDAEYEDTDASFFDANGDGFLDLYVVSGGNEHDANSEFYRDRLYLNDGKGNFKICNSCLPDIRQSGSVIAIHDYNEDGLPDIFLGGRVSPGNYGLMPQSYLLQNQGTGIFSDVTLKHLNVTSNWGMVTDATWFDINNDGKKELIVVGEWMAPQILRYEKGVFKKTDASLSLSNHSGWWNSLSISDVNQDGYPDLMLGNWGLNSIFTASAKEPITLLVNDFNEDRKLDPILLHYLKGVNGTFLGRDLICSSMPIFFNKFHKYEIFARSKVEDLFPKHLYQSANRYEAKELRSGVFLNQAGKHFIFAPFPQICQMSPVNTILPLENSNEDSHYLILGNSNQNFYDQGDIDANYSIELAMKRDSFVVISDNTFGLKRPLIIQTAKRVNTPSGYGILLGVNDDFLRFYQPQKTMP